MENQDVIVLNLEQNINRLIAAIDALPKKEVEHGVVEAINAKEIPLADMAPVIEAVNAVGECMKGMKMPEIDFGPDREKIVSALHLVEKAIEAQELNVHMDTSKIEELLTAVLAKDTEKIEFPTVYPLPEDQIAKLVEGMDDKAQLALLEKVVEAIGNIRVSGGGGGPDIVGLKKTDVNGKNIQINPMENETGAAIVNAIQNIVVPAPVGGATSVKQDDQSTLLTAIKTAVQNPPAPPAPVGGATEDTLQDIDQEIDRILYATQNVLTEVDSGEALNIDTNLRKVLGTVPLVENSKLKVNPVPEYYSTWGHIPLIAGASFMVDVANMSSLAVQISDAWTGTLTFEASMNGADFFPINGVAPSGVALATTATVNGIFRFNVIGLNKFQIRFTTATTGSPQISIVASPEVNALINNVIPVTGAVTTTDSILPSSITTQALPILVPPSAPTLSAGGANNFLVNWFPQIFQRLRVESAGDKRVPFAQKDNTWEQLVVDNLNRQILQDILRQLEILNNFTYQALERNGHPNLKIPEGFNEN